MIITTTQSIEGRAITAYHGVVVEKISIQETPQELPMEFAVEAQKLVAMSLEGSVG